MQTKTLIKKLLWIIGICGTAIIACMMAFVFYVEMTLPTVAVLKDVHMQMPLQIFSQDHKLIAEIGNVRRIPVTLDQVPKLLIQATLATEDQRFYDHPGVDIFGLMRAAIVLFTTGRKEQGGSTITMQVARNFFLTNKKTYVRKLREILLALKIDHIFAKNKILELYFNKIFYGHRAYGIAAAAKIYYGKTLDQLTLPEIAMLAGIPKAPSRNNPLANPKEAIKRRNHVLNRMLELKFIDQTTYQRAITAPITAKYHGFKVSLNAPYVAEMVRQKMFDEFGDDIYEHGYIVYTTINSRLQHTANTVLDKAVLAYDQRHGYRGAEKNLGKVNLTNFDQLLTILRHATTVNQLQPAIVTNITNHTADVLLKSGNIVTLKWDGLIWARHETISDGQEYLSPLPQFTQNILKVGDLIRVTKNQDGSFRLAQLPNVEAALVVINPNDGAILALNGGFNFYRSKFNRATQATRQPGSSFKPFIYSAALEKGFTLASVINDAPIAIPNAGGENSLWRPENDTKKFYGPTRLRVALDHSRNLVSIRLLRQIGIPYAIDYITRFGFDRTKLPNSLSLALGTAEITPLEMASAYSVFANGGYQIKPYLIDKIINFNDQKIIYQTKPLLVFDDNATTPTNNVNVAPRIISKQNAYLINTALRDVVQHGTGQAAMSLKRNDLAGKTGTTNDQKDAWFSGFNSNLVVTTWMGFDQSRSLYEYAAQSALPMWIDFMRAALKNQSESMMPQPEDIITVRIDKQTGLLAQADDPNSIFEIFRQKYAPTHSTIQHYSDLNQNDTTKNIDQLY
ncbi:MAG: penicillin-binding protein 1A [Gammaproteobacteria bacterium]